MSCEKIKILLLEKANQFVAAIVSYEATEECEKSRVLSHRNFFSKRHNQYVDTMDMNTSLVFTSVLRMCHAIWCNYIERIHLCTVSSRKTAKVLELTMFPANLWTKLCTLIELSVDRWTLVRKFLFKCVMTITGTCISYSEDSIRNLKNSVENWNKTFTKAVEMENQTRLDLISW